MKANTSSKAVLIIICIQQLSCQQNLSQHDYNYEIEQKTLEETVNERSLSENHSQIDLSLSTLEQQNIDKQIAAKKLEDARKERIIIEINNSDNVSEEINVATYARNTSNKKGMKIFSRAPFSNYNNWNECSKFKTQDDAQIAFIKNGGPQIDFFNLDPDGDGFACSWDPEIYRSLSIPNE